MNQRPREVGLPATLGTGILHGCSGSGHLLGVMPALAMPSWSIAFTYLLTFGLGTMLAMSIFTAVVGELSSQMSERLQDPSTPGRLALASSLFALIMGTVSDHFMPALIFVLRHARYSMASARPQSRLELSPHLAASRAGMDRPRALLLHTAPHRSRLVRRGWRWWTHLRGVERSVISTASCMARSRALLARDGRSGCAAKSRGLGHLAGGGGTGRGSERTRARHRQPRVAPPVHVAPAARPQTQPAVLPRRL